MLYKKYFYLKLILIKFLRLFKIDISYFKLIFHDSWRSANFLFIDLFNIFFFIKSIIDAFIFIFAGYFFKKFNNRVCFSFAFLRGCGGNNFFKNLQRVLDFGMPKFISIDSQRVKYG